MAKRAAAGGGVNGAKAPRARRAPVGGPPAAEPFTGFPPGALGFLSELAANQTRDWFEANRHRYEGDVRAPLGRLVGSLTFALAAAGVPLIGDPVKSLFRIHRDVRFSKDKSPYKTNAGAILTRDGSKSRQGLLYIHLDPAGSFVAGGFYMPEPEQLMALRRRIAERQSDWLAVEAAMTKAKLAFTTELVAARLPKPFVAEEVAAVADAIRLKSFETQRPLTAAMLARPDLVDRIVQFAKDARPLLEFGWAALAAAPRKAEEHKARHRGSADSDDT